MRSKATAEMNSAIGKWISTTCCACLAKSAVLRSKGFTITLPLLRFGRGCSRGRPHLRPPPPCRFCSTRRQPFSISIGQSGLSLFGPAICRLRNHPQSVAIQDIDEISLVLKPLDHFRKLLHYSRSDWIRQIPKYKVFSGGTAVHRENLGCGNDRQIARQAHPARQVWVLATGLVKPLSVEWAC